MEIFIFYFSTSPLYRAYNLLGMMPTEGGVQVKDPIQVDTNRIVNINSCIRFHV